jgi:HAMP domain-containing protein
VGGEMVSTHFVFETDGGYQMFHSIRWRLVTSYVLLILVTVGAIGFIAQWAVKNYTQQQTTNSLKANAESIALQAQSLMESKPSIDELVQIAHASSQFGNLQVRIYNRNRQLLVDSGLPGGANELTWFVLPSRNIEILPGIHTDSLIIGMPILRQPAMNEERLPFLEQLPPNTPLTIIRRVEEPWGYSLFLQRTNWHNVLPRDEIGTEIDDADRSDLVITVPIGDRKDPLGYVELSNGMNFEAEALSTSRRALLIAGSIAIVFAVIMGYGMGKRLSRPITNLTETTRVMSSGDLSVRASIGRND